MLVAGRRGGAAVAGASEIRGGVVGGSRGCAGVGLARRVLRRASPMTYRSDGVRFSFLAASLLAALLAGCGDDGGGGGDDDPDPEPEPGDPTTGAWRAGFVLPGPSGQGARVEDVARGPDGHLYVAGIFDDVAGTPARNIARWTGAAWQDVGGGLDAWIRAIGFDDDGALFAAMTRDDGTSRLAVYAAGGWSTFGPGLDGSIRALGFTDDGVVIVGDFTAASATRAASVARWNGLAYEAVGTGAIDGAASALAVTETGFCVAGSFTSIGGVDADNAACWDGVAWTPLGAGLPGGVAELVRAPDGRWFAGGTLTFVVDDQTGAYEAGIAVLEDGTWRPFAGGVDNGFINEVRAIAFDGDDVLVGGCFQSAGAADVPASFLARWSPTGGWSELAGGAINDVGVFLPSIEGGNDLLVDDDGTIWVGGLFTRAGGAPAVNLARVDADGTPAAVIGDATALGLGGFVDALAVDGDGRLLAGGGFAFAGMTPASGLAAFDGAAWTALDGELGGIVRAMLVRADGALAVAGELVVDGEPVAFAQWDGAAWSLPAGPVRGAGFALVEDADGVLWLGGDLVEAGGAQVSHLARLDDAGWSGGGVFDQRVTSLVIHDGALVAGGLFGTVDGAPAQALAIRTDAGWAELGGGVADELDYVSALASSPALGLVVGGAFGGVGDTAIADLARWDGAAWHALGDGVTSTSGYAIVSAVLPYGDSVFVTGGFDRAGDVPVANLAWFDGAAWHDLGGGLGDLAEELIVVDDVLYVGGPFTTAGGAPSAGLAAWDFAAE